MMIKESSILVIDDESVIRDGCKRILSRDGCVVEGVENGRKGIDLIKNRDFDLILLDLMMPGMNGLEVIQEVNKISFDIYIIVITGYATVETAVEAMKSGAYDYIPKPFTPDQLRVVVRKALENKALHLEAAFLRKEQEKGLQAIAQEKSKIRTILNCMPDGLLVIDKEKRIVLLNPIATKLLNIKVELSIGELLEKCINCSELYEMVSNIIDDKIGTETILAGEITGYLSIPLMAHVAPVRMDDNEVVGVVAIVQDISEQKAIDMMKADFIARVTHELKAPVAAINQLLMAMETGAVGALKEKQRAMMERARLRGEGLLDLISDLLNFSKIDSGMAMQKMLPLKMTTVIEDVVDLLKPQADKKEVKINLVMANDLPEINADSDGMREVFTNLINNAIKYTDNGGEIIINSEMDREFLKISIIDNGIGIGNDDLPNIFEKFFRVKNSRTRQIIGTGLGLPIVKEIVDAHLGLIEVNSQEGEGSTFQIFLPRICD